MREDSCDVDLSQCKASSETTGSNAFPMWNLILHANGSERVHFNQEGYISDLS